MVSIEAIQDYPKLLHVGLPELELIEHQHAMDCPEILDPQSLCAKCV